MLEVDKNTFQTEVLEADGYVFVDLFWRWMCSVCSTYAKGTRVR